jgi:hypothetical protein
MSVREATAQDLNAILNLYSELQPEDQRLDDAAAAALFDTFLATPPPPPLSLMVYVAEANGEVVATCYLNVIANLTRPGGPTRSSKMSSATWLIAAWDALKGCFPSPLAKLGLPIATRSCC